MFCSINLIYLIDLYLINDVFFIDIFLKISSWLCIFIDALFLVHSKVEPTSVERRNISLSGLTIKSENIENGVRFSASLPSYLSSILDSDLGGTAKDELPSMILMRCTTCLMYLMVVKADSKCPKCKNQMMDAAKFWVNPT